MAVTVIYLSGYSVPRSLILSEFTQVKKGLTEFVFDVWHEVLCIEKGIERFFMADLWAMIKQFLPNKGYRNVWSNEDVDVFWILSLISNCKLFDRHVTVDLNNPNNVFSELLTLKKELEVAPQCGFTHKQTLQYLQTMLEVLEAVKTKEFNKNVKEAHEEIKTSQKRFRGMYDVKHRPPEISLKEIAANDKAIYTVWKGGVDTLFKPSGIVKITLIRSLVEEQRRHSSSSGLSELSLKGKRRPVFLPDTWTRERYEAKKTSGLVQMGLLLLISSQREESVKRIHREKKPSQSEWEKALKEYIRDVLILMDEDEYVSNEFAHMKTSVETLTYCDILTSLYNPEIDSVSEYHVEPTLMSMVQSLPKLRIISCISTVSNDFHGRITEEIPRPDVPCVPQSIERNMVVHLREDLNLPAPYGFGKPIDESKLPELQHFPESFVQHSFETEVDDTQKGFTRNLEESNKNLQERGLSYSCPRETWSFEDTFNDVKHLGDNEELVEEIHDTDLTKHTSEERPGDGNLSVDNEEFVVRSYDSDLSKHTSEERPGDGNLSAKGQEDQTLAGVYSEKQKADFLHENCFDFFTELKEEERQVYESICREKPLQSKWEFPKESEEKFFLTSYIGQWGQSHPNAAVGHIALCIPRNVPIIFYSSEKEITDFRVKKKNNMKARKTGVNNQTQAINNRWISFKEESQIKIQQSLKKWRGIVVGTRRRQGYKGSEDKPDGKRLESPGMTIAEERNKSPQENLFSFTFDSFSLFPKLSMSPGSSKLTLKLFVLVSLFCCSPVTGNNHEFHKWDVDVELFFRGNSNIRGSQFYYNNVTNKHGRSVNISSTSQLIEKHERPANISSTSRSIEKVNTGFAESIAALSISDGDNLTEDDGDWNSQDLELEFQQIESSKKVTISDRPEEIGHCHYITVSSCSVFFEILTAVFVLIICTIYCLYNTLDDSRCEIKTYVLSGASFLLVCLHTKSAENKERSTGDDCHGATEYCGRLVKDILFMIVMTLGVLCLCYLLSGMQRTVHYKNSVVGKNPQAITSLLEVENEVYRKVHFETHDPVCLGTDEDAVTDEHTSEEFLSLKTKPQDITIDDIENLRSDQQRQQLIDEVYSSKYNKNEHVEDDVPLTVAENEVEIHHQFCQRKRFTLSQTEEILFDYMSEDLIQEEAEQKDDDIDSDPLDFTETQYIGGAQIVENELVSDEKTQKIDIPKENTTSQDRGASCFGDQPIDCNGEVTDIQRKSDCNTIKKDRKPSIEVKQQETTLISHKGSKLSYKNKHKVTMEVVPTPTFVTEKQAFSHRNNTKTWNSFRSFQNLKYKVEGENTRKRKIDCTLTEHEFDVFLLRKFTWLSLDQLPAPTLDPSVVGFVQEFEPLMVIIDLIASGTPPSPHVSMRYELLRFCTLRSYPKENKPYLIKLAEAGFYYASDGDGVVCYCCGVRRYNWTAEDNPRKIHERVNPNCKFLKKNGEVNVPVAYFGPFSESLVSIMGIEEPEERPEVNEDVNSDWAPERIRSPAPRPQNSQMEARTNSLGINTSIPKHTQYATKTSREVSFSGWPDTASHSPQELAEAGFFYAGFGDCVRCFFCGIGLRHWTKDDNPWIEHARWARNCVFVKQKKGEEFVNLVQLAVQYSQNNEEQTSESATGNQTPSEIERLLLSDAAQSVLEMGYQPSIIKKAIEQIRRQNSNAKLTAANLMEKVLDIEEAEKEATPVAAAPAATASEKALEGAQPTGRSTKENKDKEKQTDTKKETDKKKEKDHNRGKEAAMLEAKMKANETKQQDPKVIKEENEQLKEQTLCKVCLDNTVCIVFLPCGHLVTCADCAPAMRKCPICRALVKGTVRTYMS